MQGVCKRSFRAIPMQANGLWGPFLGSLPRALETGERSDVLCWVAVKELKLSYYIGETLLPHYGNLNPKP